MFRITPSTTRSILTRSLSTSAPSRLRPRETLSTSASQPVFKKDLPPQPRPPTRPLPSSPRSAPTPSGADRGKGGKEEVKGGKPGSIYASYKALPYNTKLVFWTCGAVFAAMGLLAADKLEEIFPARNNRTPSSSAKEGETGAKYIQHEEAKKPKLFSISVVDRS